MRASSVGAELDATSLRAGLEVYAKALADHREAINRLNVYPVPDGDTGTNMALTVGSVITELDSASPTMAATCRAIAHGSLMGARGNSGVILSQILRGLTDVLAAVETVDGDALGRALRAASQAADRAVHKPVEGTILSVMRAAAEGACGGAGQPVVAVLDAALDAARVALARTPEQLAVLRDAGVVDAGGSGLVLLFEALLFVLADRPVSRPAAGAGLAANRMPIDTGGGPRFEVMYLLEVDDAHIDGLKSRWSELGESIVVVGGSGLYNCHVHTDDIGGAIEVALDLGGRPSKIRVSDLEAEIAEHDWVREAAPRNGTADDVAPVTTGVVAVGAGDGIARIFRSMGVSAVVAGGQSMNPSTADLLAAAEAVPSHNIVILPNNRNIVPVAEQVVALASKSVRVVPTRSIAEGLACLVAYDPEAELDANATGMAAAAEHVAVAEVTRAVRDAASAVGPVKAGDYIGLDRQGIAAVAATPVAAAIAVLATLIDGDHELVTVIAGAEANPAETDALLEWVGTHHPELTVESHHGGQPLYHYYLGVE